MAAEAFPLQWPEGWPRTAPNRRGVSRFGKNLGYNQLTKLQNELRLLGARNVVISSNVPLRQDGLPYASETKRRYDDPGVAVYFTLKGKALSMARDPYNTPWENIRSLILAIDAIRSIGAPRRFNNDGARIRGLRSHRAAGLEEAVASGVRRHTGLARRHRNALPGEGAQSPSRRGRQ